VDTVPEGGATSHPEGLSSTHPRHQGI
jgi:hypothetical protein